MTELQPRPGTILDTLLALENVTDLGVRFVERNGDSTFHTYAEVLQRALSVAATLQRKGLEPGDRVGLILPTSIGFLDAFLGIQLAGGIPAALYPPFRLGKLDQYFKRTSRMLSKIGTRFLVADRRTRILLGPAVQDVASLDELLDVDKLPGGDSWTPVQVQPDSPAFIQFSSGSTSDPKAVTVSHTNLLYNLAMIDTHFDIFGEEHTKQGGVCWLPLYHDMGLVGCMFSGLHHPGNVIYIGPDTFIAKPRIWFQTLSKYRSVISPAPDFAYGLCLSKVKDEHMEGLDLSNWRIALNGAEPVNPDVVRRFTERFARWGFRAEAMTPAYGLAEAVLAVCFSDRDSEPVVTEFDQERLASRGEAVPGPGRRIISSGRPMPGLKVEIRDEQANVLGEDRVGRILVQGPTISSGYFNDPEATRETFRDGWLDTGDLGFLHRGELYVSGRIKDLLIIRGKNFAPQEIEELLDGTRGLRTGCTVAVSAEIDGQGEQLIVLAERAPFVERPDEEIAADVRNSILAGVGLNPHDVQILEPGTLPRTSSGKMQRASARQMYLAGQLLPPKTGKINLFKEIARSQAALAGFWLNRKRRS